MFDILTTYLVEATRSDFFAGGLALGLFGALLAAGSLALALLRRAVERRMLVSVTLDSGTAAYRHLYAWLDQTGALAHVRHVRVTDICRDDAEVYGPAPGIHWFRHAGRLCRFERRILERRGASRNGTPTETVTLTVVFGRLSTVQGWVREGARLEQERARIGPGLHVLRRDYWDSLGDVPGRSLETVLADDDRIDGLLTDVRRFYSAREWYADRGVPWRRGYLLHGPPGTGKSSVIRAIATELRRDMATLDLGRPDLTDDDLREGLVTAPRGALIVIEDVDAVFRQREGDGKGVSFSGLLNALDGVAAQEGRALFLTTNHRDRLDPALIRPGRTDVHLELGPVGADAAARLFARFFPGEDAMAHAFRARIGARRFTPAELQGWLLSHADDAAAASSADGLIGCETPRKLLAAE